MTDADNAFPSRDWPTGRQRASGPGRYMPPGPPGDAAWSRAPGAPPHLSPPTTGPPPPPPRAPQSTATRHRPGPGLVVGLLGLGAVVLSLVVLPWASANGQDITLADLRGAFERAESVAEASSAGQVGAGASDTPQLGTGVRLAPEHDATTESANDRYLQWYVDELWLAVVALATVAVVFAAAVVPRSHGGRLLTGFLTFAFVGVFVNAFDAKGSVGPRVCGALATLLAFVIQASVLYVLLNEPMSPRPAVGAWVGAAGLGAAGDRRAVEVASRR